MYFFICDRIGNKLKKVCGAKLQHWSKKCDRIGIIFCVDVGQTELGTSRFKRACSGRFSD